MVIYSVYYTRSGKSQRKRFGEKNECSLVWLHQPKSLFETSLLIVKDSTSAIRRKKIRLEKTKDELKATKDKMRKTIFSVDTIRNNDKLCKHDTGFPNLSQLFPFYYTTSFSLGFSGEQ